jgi:hypothetical protein
VLVDDRNEQRKLRAALEHLVFRVHGEAPGVPPAPDLVIAQRSFAGGRGSIAVTLVRPRGPEDCTIVLAELAKREQLSLARKLGVPPEELSRRLADLLPGLSRRSAFDRTQRDRPGAESEPSPFALQAFLQEVEVAVIALMLGCARSDREAALFLGVNEATLRSKMKKLLMRSARARSSRPA